ncbi:F-box only protein 27-like [Leptodactylus fuscus]|uniref:F-box only protein 27-like n=1 Tax=Leptodactylus fuscus TaxID=238119 RepID=UPI003F4EB59D
MGQCDSQTLPPSRCWAAQTFASTFLRSLFFPRCGEFLVDLETFPDEILFLIFSFVPEQDLILGCRLVSRRWKRLVDSPFPWRIRCEREHRKEIVFLAELCPDFSWQRVCIKTPFSRNLLRNPCGKEKLNHWSFRHGGDEWCVNEERLGTEDGEAQTCFVPSSSYWNSKKSQLIDLVGEGLWEHVLDVHQPAICIADWFIGGRDCDYEVTAELLAADMKTIMKKFSGGPNNFSHSLYNHYHQVYYEFQNYGPGVRYVNFTHGGGGWKHWETPRILNSSVKVKCENLKPCR